jgi:hypothetical protein
MSFVTSSLFRIWRQDTPTRHCDIAAAHVTSRNPRCGAPPTAQTEPSTANHVSKLVEIVAHALCRRLRRSPGSRQTRRILHGGQTPGPAPYTRSSSHAPPPHGQRACSFLPTCRRWAERHQNIRQTIRLARCCRWAKRALEHLPEDTARSLLPMG